MATEFITTKCPACTDGEMIVFSYDGAAFLKCAKGCKPNDLLKALCVPTVPTEDNIIRGPWGLESNNIS